MKIEQKQQVTQYFSKPSNSIEPSLIENNDDFKKEFFEGFEFKRLPRPLALTTEVSKDYLFPTLYDDVVVSIAMFTCSFFQAQKILKSTGLKPIRLGFDRSALIVSTYHYSRVSGMSSYNEIGISIPVVRQDRPSNILHSLKFLYADDFGYYVLAMPVSSLENKIRGEKIWGLPKEVHEINITSTPDYIRTESKNKLGQKFLDLTLPKVGKSKQVNQKANVYSMLGDKLKKSITHTKGDFHEGVFLKNFFFNKIATEGLNLVLGSSHQALILKQLKVNTAPFFYRVSNRVSTAFDLPV